MTPDVLRREERLRTHGYCALSNFALPLAYFSRKRASQKLTSILSQFGATRLLGPRSPFRALESRGPTASAVAPFPRVRVPFIGVNRRIATTTLTGCFAGVALAWLFHPNLYPPYDEGMAYAAVARLNFAPAASYYASRVLHPLTARMIARLLHEPVGAHAFLVLSVISLIAFFTGLGAYYGMEFGASPSLWLLLAVTAPLIDSYRNYYWQDLFFAALCVLYFLVLRVNWWLSLAFIPLLFVTRESVVVLVAATVLVTAASRKWKLCFSGLAVGLVGTAIKSRFVAHALPNRHGISVGMLDALKIPYNFLLNICGLEFWTNTIAEFAGPPEWVRNLPSWVHLGNIHQIGFSGFHWDRPVRTLVVMASGFGLVPLVAWRSTKQERMRGLSQRTDMAIACVYGILMFILVPLQGTAPGRYILYAWPLFWIFGVAELEAAMPAPRKRVVIVVLSLCASWTPALVSLAITKSVPQGPQSFSDLSDTGLVVSLAIVALIYACGWWLVESSQTTVTR